MGIRLIRFMPLKPDCWFLVPKCMKNIEIFSKIAGKWSASSFKTHDSTGVFRILCYWKLTRFLCKWNIGRKRVNITANFGSSYTSLTGVKEAIRHFNKELHIWSCRRPRSSLEAWLWKNYSVTWKKCYLQTSLTGVKEAIRHFTEELHIWSCRRPRSSLEAWLWKNFFSSYPGFSNVKFFWQEGKLQNSS